MRYLIPLLIDLGYPLAACVAWNYFLVGLGLPSISFGQALAIRFVFFCLTLPPPLPYVVADQDVILRRLSIAPGGEATAKQLAGTGAFGTGFLYPQLLQLEQRRLIESRWIDGSYPRSRVYRLTETGWQKYLEDFKKP